ncbi:MAG: hypothetical protein QOE71_1942 [Pseudonocardiales bacterium]|nr:hypothetical protein [Pseudonocardiales bacterium]
MRLKPPSTRALPRTGLSATVAITVGLINGTPPAAAAVNHLPVGALDSPAVAKNRTVTLTGCALDLDARAAALSVRVQLDSRVLGSTTAAASDAAGHAPGRTGCYHGWFPIRHCAAQRVLTMCCERSIPQTR